MPPIHWPKLGSGRTLVSPAHEKGSCEDNEKVHSAFEWLTIIGLGSAGEKLFAQKILSRAELETGCQVYADKAVKMAKEWEDRQCGQRLGLFPQLMDTDRTWHYTRCKNSVGTSIDANLKLLEDDLKKCPDASDSDGGQTAGTGMAGTGNSGGNNSRRDNHGWNPPRRDNPRNEASDSGGNIWDITVVNSADLARSYHVYRIPSLNGMFTGQNMNPAGGPDFKGQMNGSVFEAVMTDNTGYRAHFIGYGTMPGDIEGTGCDNRNRSFSFIMERR